MTAYPRRRNPVERSERLGQMLIAEHQADLAALAVPFPSSVSYAHFICRALGAAIEAGRCTVTMPHPLFASMPGVRVVDVAHLTDGNGFLLTTFDGSQWKRYCKGDLAVTWHEPQADAWTQLSPPMQNALRYLAGDCDHKPRWNTMRALQKRRLIRKGRITRSALALYRNHQQEFDGV